MSIIKGLTPLGDLKTKRLIKAADQEFGLIYFGNVSQKSDEHQTIKGVTFSPRHVDRHYSVGTVEGYDVTLLERHDKLLTPGKPREDHRWLLLRINLKPSLRLGQVIVDNNKHTEAYYVNTFAKFGRLSLASQCFDDPEYGNLATIYSFYTAPDNFDALARLVTPDTGKTLVQHFARFDVEWYENQIIVTAAETIRPDTVELMLREALWLARYIESTYNTLS